MLLLWIKKKQRKTTSCNIRLTAESVARGQQRITVNKRWCYLADLTSGQCRQQHYITHIVLGLRHQSRILPSFLATAWSSVVHLSVHLTPDSSVAFLTGTLGIHGPHRMNPRHVGNNPEPSILYHHEAKVPLDQHFDPWKEISKNMIFMVPSEWILIILVSLWPFLKRCYRPKFLFVHRKWPSNLPLNLLTTFMLLKGRTLFL